MFGLGRLNAAVVGTGYMATKMAAVLNASPTVRPYAIVSRDLDRALSFGRENGFKKAYDSMEAMLADQKVNLVYIATPASEHASQVRLCIEAGKPVLCETPIALTAAEAESLFSLSSSLDVLVVEAVHIRFLPFFKQIVSVISSGAVPGWRRAWRHGLFSPQLFFYDLRRPGQADPVKLCVYIRPGRPTAEYHPSI